MGRIESRSNASSSTPVASTGSFGNPSVRANTFVEPPGSVASAQSVPTRPLAASFSVPPPPSTTTTSVPDVAAPRAWRVAFPRRVVSTSVTSWSAESAFWITTRPRAVTDEADELTRSRTFTRPRNVTLPFCECLHPRRGCSAVNVVVCVKQIPDPAVPGQLDPQTHFLKREGKLILDDSDAYGVEMALQLATAAGGGDVTLVSMAPNNETSGLRTALAMGAAKAILVSDESLKGSDALSTAKVLAAAIKRAEPDLVITATEATDGYTGTVPEQVAALLGLPSITFAKKIEIADGKAKVERQTEAGYDEVTAPLPAVVSVTAGVVEPRYPSFKGIMAAKNKPVEELKVADLGIDAGAVGLGGARQEITDVAAAEARKAGEIVEDDGEAYQRIVQFLEQLKVI